MSAAAFFISTFLLIATTLVAQNKKPIAAPVPAWVTATSVNYNDEGLNSEAEDGAIDLAFERQVNLETEGYYYKKAIKILSETGVQNNAQIEVSYDPEYQQLVFHSIRVVRGGSSINKLQLSKLKVVQQENEMSRFLYNGLLTAMFILDDIRKGDVVEYTYSINGDNPVFNKKFADVFSMQFSVPICQLYYKLIVPSGRSVQIKNIGTDVSPVVRKDLAITTYEWQLSTLSALKVPGDLPSWYDPFATVQISEYKSWQEVVRWALNLYNFNTAPSPQVQTFVARIRKEHPTPEAQVTAALRFVQDEIRYMGVEMGANSHKPHHPEQVFIQRYGDCKDKSLLLCTLLRSLGIEANPVLINTVSKKAISKWIPSPYAFDHVTVQVRLKDAVYYVDPTISYQRGNIDQIAFPNYQIGLVVAQETSELADISLQDKGRVQVREAFFIKNMAGTSSLKVTTKYSGSFADDVRSRFKSESLNEIKKGYQEFYQAYFKNITAVDLSYKDDDAEGVFTTIETYTIKEIWGDNSNFRKASFEPFVISGIIERTKEQKRIYPLSISFPRRYEEEVLIDLPENWKLENEVYDTEGPGFRLTNKYYCSGKKVKLHYTYEVLKDHITPQELEEHLSAIRKADKNIGYSLTQSIVDDTVAGTSSTTFSNNYTSFYLLLGLCVLITFLLKGRRD